jgi:lysozyme
MSFIDDCMLMIKIEEGWRAHPYDDVTGRPVRAPMGKITIGYGFNLADRGMPVQIGNLWLLNLLTEVIKECETLAAYTHLSDARKMVLVDMIFNMGFPAVSKFKLFLAALGRQDWATAAKEIENSAYFQQVPTRAGRKIEMILKDENVYL